MKKFFEKLLEQGFFAIGVALGVAILAMVGLVQAYTYFWGDDNQELVIENPVQKALSEVEPGAPVETLYLRKVPGPFLTPDSPEPIGVVFLDIAIEISGQEAFQAASDNLDVLLARYTEILKTTGANRSDLPGEVDFDRLGKTFLTLARDELSLKGITAVTISEAGDG